MKKYYAVGTDDKGRKYAGSFEAASEGAARRMLASEGYKILTLEELSADDERGGAAQKKMTFRPDEKKDKESSGKAFAGGAAQKKAGTGAVLLAAALALAGLLGVMGYLSSKKIDLALDGRDETAESRLSGADKAVMRAEIEKEMATDLDASTAEEEVPAAVDAEDAEVRVSEYRGT